MPNTDGRQDFQYVPSNGGKGKRNYTQERHLPIDLRIVSKGDRAQWEPLFVRSYLIYRPLDQEEVNEISQVRGMLIHPAAGDDREAREAVSKEHADHVLATLRFQNNGTHIPKKLGLRLKAVQEILDLNWSKFLDPLDPTMCVIAHSQAGHDVDPSLAVGITYGTRVYDPKYADHILEIEGTYVPSEYRARGIASQLLPAFAAVAGDKLHVKELQYWTWEHNTDTRNVYPNVKSKDHEFDARQTDEKIWVLPLTQRTASQYQSKIADAGSPEGKGVRLVQASDKEAFLKLYADFLSHNGYEVTSEKCDTLWANVQSDKTIRSYVLEKDGAPRGIAIVQEGVKLPRDPFVTCEIGAFYIEPEHRNRGSAQAIVREIVRDIKARGSKTEAIRWRMHSNDPHLKLLETIDIPLTDSSKFVRPAQLPFKTFRLPLTEKTHDECRTPGYQEIEVSR